MPVAKFVAIEHGHWEYNNGRLEKHKIRRPANSGHSLLQNRNRANYKLLVTILTAVGQIAVCLVVGSLTVSIMPHFKHGIYNGVLIGLFIVK